uniref:SET domain-containing protein n=1 Tax=Romanomermis culicivorax TaxID=13658 RepID=A0A915I1B6_ROMCU
MNLPIIYNGHVTPPIMITFYNHMIYDLPPHHSSEGSFVQLKKSSRSHPEAPVIDAYDKTYSNWMRYVNCARNEEEQNLIALFYKQQIYYATCKPIRRYDDELLIWYGSAYGKLLGIENAETAMGPTAPKKTKRSDLDDLRKNPDKI